MTAPSGGDAPINRSQVATLWFNRFAQGIYITLPYTLSVFMVRSFEDDSASEESVGRKTGLLAAAASVGQCLSSFVWGTISDHIGRKPVLMVGNMSACISVTALGLAPNYAAAMASRFVGGLFTSSTGVSIKSIVAESYGPVGQAKLIGYTTAGYSIGTIAGPTIGGALAFPCDSILSGSTWCHPDSWLFTRPFLLACLVSACMSACAFVSNTLLMSETNPRFTSASYAKLSSSNDTEQQQLESGKAAAANAVRAEGADSQVPLSPQQGGTNLVQLTELSSAIPSSTLADSADGSGNAKHASGTNSQQQHGMQQLESDRPSAVLHQSIHNAESFETYNETNSDQSEEQQLLSLPRHTSSQEEAEQEDQQQNQHALSNSSNLGAESSPEPVWYKQGLVLVCLAGGGLIVLCVNYLDELAPIFASAQASQGGLGMTASAFAWPLAFGGSMLMLYSIFVYPELQKKWGRMHCCQAGLLASVCAALLIPTSHFFASYWWLAQLFMFVAIGIRSVAKVTSLSSSTIIVNTVAPMSQIGSVNGAGQTLNALARSVGPLVAGVVWGTSASSHVPGKQYLPFIGSICLLLITFGLYKRIKLQN